MSLEVLTPKNIPQYKYNVKKEFRIIKFIIECQKTTELNDIFYTVEIISSVLYDDHLSHEFILILAQDLVYRLKQIEKNGDDNNAETNRLNTQIDLLFQFASSTIFFQRTNLRNFEEEYRHSVFYYLTSMPNDWHRIYPIL